MANYIHEQMKKYANGLNMSFKGKDDDVKWVEAANQARKASDYIEAMGDLLQQDSKRDPVIEFALVIIKDKNIKKDIKRWADSKGIVT